MLRFVFEWLKRVVLELQDYMRLVGNVGRGLVTRPVYGRDIVEQLRNRRTHWGRTTAAADVPTELRDRIETSLKELGEQVTSSSGILSKVRTELTDLAHALSAGPVAVELGQPGGGRGVRGRSPVAPR